jgi:hypothetical protein
MTRVEVGELAPAFCPDPRDRTVEAELIRCSHCPESASFPAGGISASRLVKGHFRSATSDDALVATSGCEPHATNFGGAMLLTRRDGAWRRVWYEPGLIIDRCRIFRLPSGQDVLLCEDLYVQGGCEHHTLFTIAPSAPGGRRMRTVMAISDNLRACYVSTRLWRAFIERIELQDLNGDRIPDLRVLVQYGRRYRRLSEAEVERYCAGENPRGIPTPPLAQHRFEFLYGGDGFRLAPGSASPFHLFPKE